MANASSVLEKPTAVRLLTRQAVRWRRRTRCGLHELRAAHASISECISVDIIHGKSIALVERHW